MDEGHVEPPEDGEQERVGEAEEHDEREGRAGPGTDDQDAIGDVEPEEARDLEKPAEA